MEEGELEEGPEIPPPLQGISEIDLFREGYRSLTEPLIPGALPIDDAWKTLGALFRLITDEWLALTRGIPSFAYSRASHERWAVEIDDEPTGYDWKLLLPYGGGASTCARVGAAGEKRSGERGESISPTSNRDRRSPVGIAWCSAQGRATRKRHQLADRLALRNPLQWRSRWWVRGRRIWRWRGPRMRPARLNPPARGKVRHLRATRATRGCRLHPRRKRVARQKGQRRAHLGSERRNGPLPLPSCPRPAYTHSCPAFPLLIHNSGLQALQTFSLSCSHVYGLYSPALHHVWPVGQYVHSLHYLRPVGLVRAFFFHC